MTYPRRNAKAANALASQLQHSKMIRMRSLSAIIWPMIRDPVHVKSLVEKERQTFHDMPDWLREIHERHALLAMKALLANSPLWWLPNFVGAVRFNFLGQRFSCLEECADRGLGATLRGASDRLLGDKVGVSFHAAVRRPKVGFGSESNLLSDR